MVVNSKPSNFRWHYIYYILALIDIITIVLSLWLNHNITEKFSKSVSENQGWSDIIEEMSILSKISTELNSPGNDVFENGKLDAMKILLLDREHQFERQLEHSLNLIGHKSMDEFSSDLLKTKEFKDELVVNAKKIFSLLKVNDRDEAGIHMAKMDQAFSILSSKLIDLQLKVIRHQDTILKEQHLSVKDVKKYEIAIGLTVFLIVIFVTIYGHYLANMLKQNEVNMEKEREKAEKATRAKGNFLANMSHEIRTPMNGIMGSANLLSETELDNEQKEYSKMIYHSCKSLLVIINDILDYSKIEAGKMDIEKLSMNYKTVVLDVINLLNDEAQSKGIDINLSFPDKYPKMILGDPTRLRQILLNLVSNAIKFTSEGSVSVMIEFIEQRPKDYLIRTQIIDTGIGMNSEQIESIFESFQQADSSTSRKYGGTGLGTTISKSLCELMGGKIKVTSNIGKGSIFMFEIPAEVSVEEYVNKETSQKIVRNYSKTVILAEDNLINQKVAKRSLEKMGLTVHLAINGRKVLELVKEQPHDLILMDIQMPEMNGFEAAEALFKDGYKNPIIAMTANVMPQDIKRYHECGFEGFIPKPFRAYDIASTLDPLFIENKS